MQSALALLYNLIIFGTFVFICSKVTAAETSLISTIGYNSNPLEISKAFKPPSSGYLDTSLKFSEKFNNHVSFNASTSSVNFEGNLDTADVQQHNLELKLLGWHRYFSKYLTIHSFNVAYGKFEKTYLFSDGSIANLDGESIGNRFDRESYTLNQRNKIKLNATNRIYFSWFFNDYHYKPLPDLSNLDNSKHGLGTGWIHNINEQQNLEFSFGISEQKFDDKENRTIDGSLIENSRLKIKSMDYGVQYNFTHQKNLNYWLGFDLTEGENDKNGYYASTQESAFMRASYEHSDKTTFDVKLSYSDLNYDKRNQNILLVDGEVTPISTKNQSLSYTQNHKLYEREYLATNAEFFFRLLEYKSNLSNYSYRQNTLGASLKFTF